MSLVRSQTEVSKTSTVSIDTSSEYSTSSLISTITTLRTDITQSEITPIISSSDISTTNIVSSESNAASNTFVSDSTFSSGELTSSTTSLPVASSLSQTELPSYSTLISNVVTSPSSELTTETLSVTSSNVITSTTGQSLSDKTTESLSQTSSPIVQSDSTLTIKELTSSSLQFITNTFSTESSNSVTSAPVESSSDLVTISTPLTFSSTNGILSSSKISDITTSSLPSSISPSSPVNSIGSSSQSSVTTSSVTTSNPITTVKGSSSSTAVTATTLSINQITSPYWVLTVCNISSSTDLTTSTFKTDKEFRLSNAFAVAINTIKISARRKRAAINGTNTLQLVSATRITATLTPTNLVYYVVGSGNAYISPSTVISTMNQLTTQQMSILLDAPVTIVATYYNSLTQNPGTDQKLWIIGAVFGSLAGVALIIWLVFYIYSRCIIPWDDPLILKKSVDLERSDSFSDDQIKVSDNTIQKKNLEEVVILNSEEHVNERIKNKNEKSFKEISKESIENRQSGDEIVIKHVYESRPRKYHKRHSSSSSSSSDNKKKKKSSKETINNFDSSSNNNSGKNTKKKEKKKSKIKQKSNKNKNESIISEETIVSSTLEMEMMASNTTLNTNLAKEENYDLTPAEERNVEILQYKDQLAKIDDDNSIESEKHLQSPSAPKDITKVIHIKVQPKFVPQNDMKSYDLVEPVPFVDNYEHLHIFPNYSTEIYTISDTSLNLVERKEIDKLESQRSEMKSNKNLRTFEPLPRKNVQKINHDISTDDLNSTLKLRNE